MNSHDWLGSAARWEPISQQPSNPRAQRPTTPPMTWWTIGPGCGVFKLDYISPNPTAIGVAKPEVLGLELLVWWGGGEPTRAVWFWSQTGRVMGWAGVGVA